MAIALFGYYGAVELKWRRELPPRRTSEYRRGGALSHTVRSTGVGDGDIGPSVEVDQHGHEDGTLSSHRRAGLRERRDWNRLEER